MNCPECGRPLAWIQEYNRWYCSNCQKYQNPTNQGKMSHHTCLSCGESFYGDNDVCPKCGTKQSQAWEKEYYDWGQIGLFAGVTGLIMVFFGLITSLSDGTLSSLFSTITIFNIFLGFFSIIVGGISYIKGKKIGAVGAIFGLIIIVGVLIEIAIVLT